MQGLSSSIERRLLQHRSIAIQGYVRSDGLYELDGQLVDRRTEVFRNSWLGELPAGTPLHHMTARIVVDAGYVVREIDVATVAGPFPGFCALPADAYRVLLGKSMLRGWLNSLRTLLGGTRGCTHVVELLGRMGPPAFHAVHLHQRQGGFDPAGPPHADDPLFVDGCHALKRGGALVPADFPAVALPVPVIRGPEPGGPS